MANITVSAALLATDLTATPTASSTLSFINGVSSEIISLLKNDVDFDSAFRKSGTAYIYENPKYVGTETQYAFTGKQTVKLNSSYQITSLSSAFTSFSASTVAGKYVVNGQFLASITENGGTSYSLKFSSIAFKGYDGSWWTFKGDISSSSRLNVATQTTLTTESSDYRSFAASDGEGNSLSASGNIQKASSTEPFSGYFSNLSVKIMGANLSATGLTMGQTDVVGGFGFTTVSDEISIFLSGNDTLKVSANSLPKMASNQTFTQASYSSRMYGYAGNDKMTGSVADDFLCGGNWDATLSDYSTGSGKDTLLGGAGDDSLFGADDDDWMDGSTGADWLWGGAGNDRLIGGKGADTIYCELGDDSTKAGDGNDSIEGGVGNDTIDGGTGDDSIFGGLGNDSILGGTGDDYIDGGSGVDLMIGGSGRDSFVFLVSLLSDTEVGSIKSFAIKDDSIVIRNADAATFQAVSSTSFVSGVGVTKAASAGQYYVYDSGSGTLYYDADSLDGAAPVMVCTLVGIPKLTYQNVLSVQVS